MQEHTSKRKRTIKPQLNGTVQPKSQPRGEQNPKGGQDDIAAAVGRLLRYLEDSERAKDPGQQIHHRTVVDMAELGDWLARGQKGASGENPGSSPVANRKRASGQGCPQEKAKEGNPAHQPSRPTKVFFLGHVKTKVWANYQAPGSLTWSIQQVRVYRGPKGEMEARSFRFEDLRDAMRGAYKAERWIRKQQRRHRLFGWFLGF